MGGSTPDIPKAQKPAPRVRETADTKRRKRIQEIADLQRGAVQTQVASDPITGRRRGSQTLG